jgi:hypothetical protein
MHLVETGAPLSTVRDLLGHSSLMMTDRYVHAVSDGLGSIKKLDKAGKSATIRNFETGRSEKARQNRVVLWFVRFAIESKIMGYKSSI